MAILLHQGRDPETVIEPIIKASKFVIELEFPEDFLSTHPMTVLNLESEKKLLSAACFEVSLNKAFISSNTKMPPNKVAFLFVKELRFFFTV